MDKLTKLVWYGCYKDSWRGRIVPESMQHTAKMAYGLLQRLIKHGVAEQWWKAGDTILDPFGGIGSTSMIAMQSGLNTVLIELEEYWKNWAEYNINYYQGRFPGTEHKVIHGDSRQAYSIVSQAINSIITFPPFTPVSKPASQGEGAAARKYTLETLHAHDPRNIARLNIITSPPYGNRVDKHGKDKPEYAGTVEKLGKYGDTPGQIGNLDEGETYWESIHTILEQCQMLMEKDAVLCWVVKSFTRNKKIVDVPQMSFDLLIQMGFTPIVWIDAMQVANAAQSALIQEPVDTLVKGRLISRTIGPTRKSYKHVFRRRAEAQGSTPIDNEVVIVVRK